jgi:hypothetical protein
MKLWPTQNNHNNDFEPNIKRCNKIIKPGLFGFHELSSKLNYFIPNKDNTKFINIIIYIQFIIKY